MTNETMFAAVGTDGTRDVVWGLGTNEDEAKLDALQWLDGAACELRTEPVTAEEVAAINAGIVAWPVGELAARAKACVAFEEKPGTYGTVCKHCDEHRTLHEVLW